MLSLKSTRINIPFNGSDEEYVSITVVEMVG